MGLIFKEGEKVAGRYTVEGILGDGGFSDVFKVFDNDVGRRFAMKILLDNPRQSGTALTEQPKPYNIAFAYKSEAQAGFDMVKHPNLIQLYHSLKFKHDGHPYHALLMQLVEGETLEKKVKRDGAYGEEDCIELLLKITGAVGAIHNEGMIHRDPSQRNIIIKKDGTPMICDYYLSRKPTLMIRSPETITNGEYTYLSEIYALGCLGLYALTGIKPFYYKYDDPPIREQRPFIKEQIKAGYMYDEDTMKWLRSFRLGRILLKAADKDPKKRYQSCDELIKKLTPATFTRRALLSGAGCVAASLLIGGPFYAIKKNSSKIFYAAHKLSLDMSDEQWAQRCREILEYELNRCYLPTIDDIEHNKLCVGITGGEVIKRDKMFTDGAGVTLLGAKYALSDNEEEKKDLEKRIQLLLDKIENTDYDYTDNIGIVMNHSFRWLYEQNIFPEKNQEYLDVIKSSLDKLDNHQIHVNGLSFFSEHENKDKYPGQTFAWTNGNLVPLYIFYSRKSQGEERIKYAKTAWQFYNSFVELGKRSRELKFDPSIRNGYRIDLENGKLKEVADKCFTLDVALNISAGLDLYKTLSNFTDEELKQIDINKQSLSNLQFYLDEKVEFLISKTLEKTPWDIIKPDTATDSYGELMVARALREYSSLINGAKKQEAKIHANQLITKTITHSKAEIADKQGFILMNVYYDFEGTPYTTIRTADASFVQEFYRLIQS